MGKLTRPQIWIIFGVVSLIVLVTLIFTVNKPQMEEIQKETERRDSRQLVANQKPQADQELKDALKQVAQANADWGVFERRFMPKINLTNVYQAWKQLQQERLFVLGPKLDRFVRSDKSVQIVQAQFQIPPPPDDPNQVLSPLFTYSGAVTVSGNFDAILKHVERWNTFDRLTLITGFALQGNSPRLVGSYSVQIFEFTQNPDKPGQTFPAAAGGAGGGLGGGGFGPGGPGAMGPGGPGMAGADMGAAAPGGPGLGGPAGGAPLN